MALSQLVCLILIHWIEIYPMDSAIRRLNKPGLGSFLRSCRFFGGRGMARGEGGTIARSPDKTTSYAGYQKNTTINCWVPFKSQAIKCCCYHFSTGWHPLAKYDTVLINLVTFWTWYLVWMNTHRTSSVESGLTTHQRHWEPERENSDIVENVIIYLKKKNVRDKHLINFSCHFWRLPFWKLRDCFHVHEKCEWNWSFLIVVGCI